MAKYDPLAEYLGNLPTTTERITLSFREINQIIGKETEDSAYRHLRAWDNTHSTSTPTRQDSWLEADLENQTVRFHRK